MQASSQDFVSWLRGYLEGAGATLTGEQVERIRVELDKVALQVVPACPYPLPQPYVQPSAPFTWPWQTVTWCRGAANAS